MNKFDGMLVAEINTYATFIKIHPDHFGFVIGRQGNTVKTIGRDTNTFVDGRQKPNNFSGGWPWIMIKGDNIENISQAFNRVRGIANEAEKRTPRFNVVQSEIVPKPRVKLFVKKSKNNTEQSTKPETPHYSVELGLRNVYGTRAHLATLRTDTTKTNTSPDYHTTKSVQDVRLSNSGSLSVADEDEGCGQCDSKDNENCDCLPTAGQWGE